MITHFPPRTNPTTSPSPEATFSLEHLSRLVKLMPLPGASFNAERLLRHAIFATYVDCRELGLEAQAREILVTAYVPWVERSA